MTPGFLALSTLRGIARDPALPEEYGTDLKVIPFSWLGTKVQFGRIYPLSVALGGLSHQFWGRHNNHIMPINISIKTRGLVIY